ncbi:unnamed protein product [Heterotrigona itama]|uniref:Uncharacterized protein n=1 Tax=Heterotrigona itama TaxID=395501 RepID=A0A6V7HJQ0_9HYME|nr:unnamed protein product [Heterotrigona itama]
MASGIMDALQVFLKGAATANTLAKFVIDALNVFMNAGIF